MSSEASAEAAIRDYLPRDREVCLALFESNCPKYFGQAEFQEFADWLDTPDRLTYSVIELNAQVVACGGLYLSDDQDHVGLAWGMVRRDMHGQGLGRMLAEFRLRRMSELYRNMEQRLATSQLTFRFYEKLGFEIIKVTENGFAPGIDRYDMKRNRSPAA